MATFIRNARILTPFSQMEGNVLVEKGKIADIMRSDNPGKRVQVLDAKGMYLVPGFVDLHAHGSANAHIMEGTPKAVLRMCDDHALCGTTTLLPTTAAAPLGEVMQAADSVQAAMKQKGNATIAGVHIQELFMRGPDGAAIQQEAWQALLSGRERLIRMVGIAPELPGALPLGDHLRQKGIVASIAYSGANYEQILTAVTHGFSDISDLYSGGIASQQRSGFRVPGVFESGLVMDELTVQVAADGWQLPLLSLQIVYRCKNAEGIILISDAGGKETEQGHYDEGFPTMALLVRNMVAAGVSIRVALRMATVNPARRIGLDRIKGRIEPGYDADILLLDPQLNVRFVMARGRILRDETEAL